MKEEKFIIELYVNKKYLFPNTYLDEAQIGIMVDKNDYNVYFVLHGNAYKISEMKENGRLLHITVINISKNIKFIRNK